MEISKYLKRNNQKFISYEYVNSKGEKDKGGIFSSNTSGSDCKAFGCYFKNIPNEINDFDGYCAIIIEGKSTYKSLYATGTTLSDSALYRNFEISVDGRTVCCHIKQLIDNDGNNIIPVEGFYLGKIWLRLKLIDSDTIYESVNDQWNGQSSIYPLIDKCLRKYNYTVFNEIAIKNSNGSFQAVFGKNEAFEITNISNLSFATEEISSVISAYGDGDVITNSRTNARSIEITMIPKGNIDVGIQTVFSELYKKKIYIEWTTQRWIDDWYSKKWKLCGVVNEIDVSRFSQNVSIGLKIHCSNPLWQGENVTLTLGQGGQYDVLHETTNSFFFRTKSHNTGLKLNISTNGEFMGNGLQTPQHRNFSIILLSYADSTNADKRVESQYMSFVGNFGLVQVDKDTQVEKAVNYDVEITTEYKNKNAVEKVTNTNMLDCLSNNSTFLTINQNTFSIIFNELFGETVGSYSPYVTLTYTPLFLG